MIHWLTATTPIHNWAIILFSAMAIDFACSGVRAAIRGWRENR